MLRSNDIRPTVTRFSWAVALALSLATVPAHAVETLHDAWAAAISANQAVEAARWETAAAEQHYKAARAEQMPKLTGSANYRVLDNPVTVNATLPSNPLMPNGLSVPMEVLPQDFLISGVDLSQPIYTFGRIQYQIDAAAQSVRAERFSQRTTELDIYFQVSEAYLNVLNARRMLDVASISILSLEKHQRDVKNLLNQGVVVRNDYLAVEVSLAKARQAKIQAENLLDLARATYNRFLFRPLDSPVDLEDLAAPTETYDLNVLTAQAVTCRPELVTLNSQAASFDRQACSAEASYKPQLSLSGRFDYIGNDYLQRQGYTSVGVVGKWNLFDAGRVRHQAGEYRRKAESLRRLRIDAESLVMLQVRQAWLDLDTTRRQLDVNRKAIASADENFSVAASRYRQGEGTNTEVLDAEQLRTETYHNFYTSQYATVLAQMKLKRAVGSFQTFENVPRSASSPTPPPAPMPLETAMRTVPLPPVGSDPK